MVMLGIDPGFRFAGYGILKKEGSKAFLLDHGCLKLSPTAPLVERVGLFHDFFEKKIQLWSVTDIALETPFLGKNAQNFLKLGYLRGIIYLLASQHKTHLYEFSPTQIKQSLTGFGGADKQQVARMVLQLFPKIGAQNQTLRNDITDALAITLCGLWQQKSSIYPQK